MTLYERLKAYVLTAEWSANDNDGSGPRCPDCRVTYNHAHGNRCVVGSLCEDVRTLQKAAELEKP